MTNQERRASSTSRVALETLVEICGNEPGIPAFEAEAVNVSQRGMHLKTAYLPEDGAPLVCRFENHGQEIVVEGVVAWRKESTRGGEFGVRFTALDSRSVDALRGLVAEELKGEAKSDASEKGTRVRLHIEGLGSPMKARVRDSGVQKLQVGSNLEFLKVGRKLEIEDLAAGARRTAQIDGVDVVIDPGTQVPQLVVSLRYEGVEEDTPQPSVTDLDSAPKAAPERLRLDAKDVSLVGAELDDDEDPEPSDVEARAADSDDSDEGDDSDAEDAESDADESAAFRSRIGGLAGGAGKFAEAASAVFKRAGVSTWRGMGQLVTGAGGKLAAMRANSAAGKGPKRTTAAAPGGPVSIEGKHVRQQPPTASAVERSGSLAALQRLPAKKKVALGAGAAVLLVTVLAVALKPSASSPPGAHAAAAGNAIEVQAQPSAAPAALTGSLAPGADSAAAALTPAISSGGVTANVPLFGPTPMATTEPAPLGPSSDEENVGAEEMAEAKQSAKPAAADEEFNSDPTPRSDKRSLSNKASSDKSDKSDKSSSIAGKSSKSESDKSGSIAGKKPEDVSPWGRGHLHTPTIYRLRLDAPGGEIRGVNEPVGFTVLIPSRKVMEKGAVIAKRDPRIARVRTTNTPGGAQIRIEFKDGVPAYRVRLRRDYVELLISAADDKSKTASADKDKSKAADKSKAGSDKSKLAAKKH